MDKYRQPPAAVRFWRVQPFRPLRCYIVSPAAYRATGGKRPKASTTRDTPRHMQTHPPRVEAIPYTPRSNMDNVDNMDKRPPCGEEEAARRCSFAACTTFALSFGVSTSPRPFRAVGGQSLNTARRPRLMNCTAPDMNDTDNEGKASTDEKKTDHDTDKYRQHGQPPAAWRLYTTHKNGRPLRIENGRNITTSKYGQPQTAACKYTPIYLHAAKIRKAAHKTESQRSKEERPAEGV